MTARVAPHVEKAAWDAVESRETFTTKQLRLAYPMSLAVAQEIVRRWQKLGSVSFLHRGPGGQNYYSVNQDAPRPIADLTGRSPVENMWATMKRLKSYSAIDVAAHATTPDIQVTKEQAQEYIRALLSIGYVRVLSPATKTAEALYVTTRKKLPKAPLLRRIRVIEDPNSGAIHLIERGQV